jgi:TM2 domain-containing membrane protein YozV
MIQLRKTVFLALLLIAGLWVSPLGANQGVQTLVTRDESGNLGLVRSPAFLFDQQCADPLPPRALGSLKLKSPTVAFLYALIPGLIVHGAGHFYAGHDTTGWALLIGEGIGLGFVAAWWGVTSISDFENSLALTLLAMVLSRLGTFLFVITWAYDMTEAAGAAREHNGILLEKQKKGLGLEFDQQNGRANLRLVLRF